MRRNIGKIIIAIMIFYLFFINISLLIFQDGIDAIAEAPFIHCNQYGGEVTNPDVGGKYVFHCSPCSVSGCDTPSSWFTR
jgi:hypothetical protein